MTHDLENANADQLEQLLKSENPTVLSDVACALGDLIRTGTLHKLPHSCVEKLAELLGNANFLVQLEAAIALAEIQDHRGTPLLLEAIRHKRFRLDALRSLGTMNDTRALETLRYWTRRLFAPWADKLQAAAALCKMGDLDGQQYVQLKLSSKKSAERAAAIHFMAECKHPDALNQLTSILTAPDDPLADVAARSLGLLGNDQAKSVLKAELLKASPPLADDIKEAIALLDRA